MSAVSPNRGRAPTWLRLVLPTLTITIGLQMLRLVLPLIVNHYGVRPGVTTIGMGVYALSLFLTVFLAGVLHRLLGSRVMVTATAGGLAVVRALVQFSPAPSASLSLASAGTVLFLLFLPTWLARARADREAGTGKYALALLLGLTLDTALHGLWGTYDMMWHRSACASAMALLLATALLISLVKELKGAEPVQVVEAPCGSSITFLAIGPLLLLEALLFQNVAQLAARTSWPQSLAFAWTMICNVIGVVASTLIINRPRWRTWTLALVGGITLLAAAWPTPVGGAWPAIALLLGNVGAAIAVTLTMLAQRYQAEKPGLARTTVANGIGMLLFALLTFAYYAGYDLSLPFDNAIIPAAAAVIAGLCALRASVGASSGPSHSMSPGAVCFAAALVVASLISWCARGTPAADAAGWPVRIMTYNLHQGFATDGHLGMEGLARVIDGTGADIIALQEISRGWYINGSLDMLPWLSHRLGMPYLFGPAADPIWGNAILSRYPILEWGLGAVPKGAGVMKRGYLWARVDIGDGEDLTVIATHLHHIESEHEVRIPQVEAILNFWEDRGRTIILGDMNSWPDSPEMDLLREAGLRDAFAEIGTGDGYTFASNDLYERIDYLWITPDLHVTELDIPRSTASDHLGVAVTVQP